MSSRDDNGPRRPRRSRAAPLKRSDPVKRSRPFPIRLADLPAVDVEGSYWTSEGAPIFCPHHDTENSSGYWLVLGNPACGRGILLTPDGRLFRTR